MSAPPFGNYDEARAEYLRHICGAFNIPPELLGEGETDSVLLDEHGTRMAVLVQDSPPPPGWPSRDSRLIVLD